LEKIPRGLIILVFQSEFAIFNRKSTLLVNPLPGKPEDTVLMGYAQLIQQGVAEAAGISFLYFWHNSCGVTLLCFIPRETSYRPGLVLSHGGRPIGRSSLRPSTASCAQPTGIG